MDSREAFEANFNQLTDENGGVEYYVGIDGKYCFPDIELAWKLWQAAMSHQAERPTTYDRAKWTAHQALEHELVTLEATIDTFGSPYEALIALIDWYCKIHEQSSAAVPEQQWIICEERLPAEEDADCHSEVWGCNKFGSYRFNWVQIEQVRRENSITHWMPTNLKRPAPPAEQEGE